MAGPFTRALSHTLAIAGSAGVSLAVPLFDLTIPKTGYSVRRDLAYGPDASHKLDLYIPDGLTAPAPMLLFWYGGSWQSGTKNIYRAFGQAFASHGIVTAVADYRLYPHVKYPGFIEDGALVARFLIDRAAEFGGDARRLFLSGHSAGAYIAAMLGVNGVYLKAAGLEPSAIRGIIGIAGPYDFLPLYDPALIDMFGGAREMATQPIKYAGNTAPPMLLAHGSADTTVGAGNSKRMAQRLLTAGNVVQVKLYEGVSHLGIVISLAHGFRTQTTLHADMLAFIAAH